MKFISVAALDPSWHFLEGVSPSSSLKWQTASGLPRNPIEQLVQRPKLSIWRAAAEAALAARRASEQVILVSHLPMAAAATNTMRNMLAPDVRLVAFAFNFTDLPSGRRADFYRWALKGINEFVVFSRYEVGLYAKALNIPQDRIQFLHWAMAPPTMAVENPVPFTIREAGYISSIGGEGRDYRAFAQAMRSLPHINAVVVGRPYALGKIDFPSNVTVFSNLPLEITWRIAGDSLGMVVPLKSAATATGHITIVGAQLLGLPLAVTDSIGVADYVNSQNSLLVPAGDVERLADAIASLPTEAARAAAAKTDALERSSLHRWVGYFEKAALRTSYPAPI